MLGCSADHAKRLRLSIIPESIVAILAATRDDCTKRECFRRVCLTALSAEPEVSLTPRLLVDAQAADMAEDVAETAWLAEPTPERRESLIRASERALALEADRLRALRAMR